MPFIRPILNWLAGAWLCLALAPIATAFPTQDDNTPGNMALAFKRQNNVWTRVDFGFVDAKETSTPPDSTKYDRRLEVLGIMGFDLVMTPRFGLRVNAKGDVVKRRQAESEEPKTVVDEQTQTYSPSADLTFVTDKGLEIFGGAQGLITPSYEQEVTAGEISSKTKYQRGVLLDRRFGLVRRAGVWSGGVSYSLGDQSKRDYEKTASDDSSLTGEEVIFVPSRFSIFGEFSAISTLWDFELAFVQARGKGPKNETASTLYTDFFEARLGGYYAFGNGFGFKTAVAHQTLSYASNEFVTIDTIPVTSVKALLVLGVPQNNGYFGLIAAQGKDGQSLPEFNATYEFKALAFTTGFLLPL